MKFRPKHAKSILTSFGITFPASARINQIEINHPTPTTVLYRFRFLHYDWGILFDPDADDDIDQINSQSPWPNDQIELIENPNLTKSYAMPFQQKTCYLIKKTNSQIRLDQYLAGSYIELSRSQIQKMIKTGRAKVNHKVVKSNKKLIQPTDKIELELTKSQSEPLPKIDIIYQDQNIIAVNKPSGILTHPANYNHPSEQTIADFIKPLSNFEQPDYRSGIVHRLDRATSGILLLACNQQASDYLKKQFADRTIKKTYLAISQGKINHTQAKIDLPLRRSLKQPGKFMVDPNGKSAVSYYQVVKSKPPYHLIEIKPQTGRTHQIRVHLAYLNLPIVGDYLYGGAKAERLMLHAQKISFTNLSGKKIELSTDLPKEFSKWID